MKNPWSILVVDDEPVQSESMAVWLRQDGYEVDRASSGKEAIQAVREKDYAILFIDLKMPPGIDGIETMTEVHKISPDSSVIIITAYATVDTAISAMKEGAVEYIVKPCNPQEISMLVQRIIRLKNLERENTLLRERLEKSHHFCDIISKNSTMLRICDLVRDIADLPSTVLIQGESGTGKEVVARAIHESGARAGKPFVAVSCAALAESLLESELFGHERGAFTGASQRRQGKFELAQDGTLFLDEIGDISPKLQVDLLRVLQQHSFYRVGGSQEIAVHARTIAATNVNLESAIAEGKFREDLYYRLNVINIRIPPLRERREDIPLLVSHFLPRIALELGKDVHEVSQEGMRLLLAHEWPGNVRELENVIERAIVSSQGQVLTASDFAFLRARENGSIEWSIPSDVSLREIEQKAIEITLRRTQGNIKETAALLGIDRSTLYDKISRYGIERPTASSR